VEDNTAKRTILPYSPLFAVGGIILGGIEQYIFNLPLFAHALWTIALIGAGFPVVWRTLRAARHGNYATDVVASLSIVTAAIIGQPLAGLVIVLMQTGGEALEKFAERRASAAVRELEKAAPRIAHLISGARGLVDVPVGELNVGDVFLVRPGEMVPCDGLVLSGISEIDASQLTGEAIPVPAREGTPLMSGSLNAHGVLSVRASARGRRESVFEDRGAGSGGAGFEVTAAAARRPLRGLVHPGNAGGLCRDILLDAELGQRAGGAGRGDAVPAHSRDAGRDHRGDKSRSETKDHRAPRSCTGDAERRDHRGIRQDGHAHSRQALSEECRRTAWIH